jgi:PRD1 phage membrane DNA delivery
MNDIIRDVTGIAMAIVGVAILYTLVNPSNKTAQVISASAGGFAQAITAAMGGGGSGYNVGSY